MLQFFRRIRKNLFTQNKVGKYLLYAVGEVILVVIGIIIAVSLNNANEDRKQEEKIRSTLSKVQSELAIVINNAASVLRFTYQADSLGRVVLTQEPTVDDYRGNRGLAFLTQGGFTFTVENDSYRTLISLSSDLPEKYDHILSRLKKTYLGWWPFVEQAQKDLRLKVNEFVSKDREEHPWSANYIQGVLTDEAIKYMRSDFRYKNRVSEYISQNKMMAGSTASMREVAIECYEEINTLLGTEPDTILQFVVNPNDYQDWLGSYQGPAGTAEIVLEESSMVFKLPGFPLTKVRPLDDQMFQVGGLVLRIITKGDSLKRGMHLPVGGLNELFFKKVY